MSRLFDALQTARPDITEKFEAVGAPDDLPVRGDRESPQGRFQHQFSALLQRIDNESDIERARIIGFAGLHGREGTTTVVREFAHFVVTHLQARTLVLDVKLQSGADVRPHVDGPLEPAHERAQRSYAKATLVIPDQTPPTADEIATVLDPLAGPFRWILIDGPPLLGGNSCVAALAASQSLIVVAEAERTHALDLQRAARTARAAGANVLGMILNKRPNRIPRTIRRLLRRLHLA